MDLIILAWEWALLTIQFITALAVFFSTLFVFAAAVWWVVGLVWSLVTSVLGR